MIGDTAPKRWRIAVDVLAVLTALALLSSAWALYARFNETNSNRVEIARVWHGVVCSIERQIITNDRVGDRPLTHAKLRETLAFYDRLLVEDVHAAPCGLASEVK